MGERVRCGGWESTQRCYITRGSEDHDVGSGAVLTGTISLGVRRRGKTEKHGKVEVKRKWWVLPQLPYSL